MEVITVWIKYSEEEKRGWFLVNKPENFEYVPPPGYRFAGTFDNPVFALLFVSGMLAVDEDIVSDSDPKLKKAVQDRVVVDL